MVRSGSSCPRPAARRRQRPPAENTHLLLSDHGDRRVDRVQALAQAVGVHGGGVEDLQGGALGRGGRGGKGVRRGAHRFGRLASINWSESHGGCGQVPWQPRPARQEERLRQSRRSRGRQAGVQQPDNNQTPCKAIGARQRCSRRSWKLEGGGGGGGGEGGGMGGVGVTGGWSELPGLPSSCSQSQTLMM